MKVALVSKTFFPCKFGGIPRWTAALYEFLSQSHETYVITSLDGQRLKDKNVIQLRVPHQKYLVSLVFSLRAAHKVRTMSPDVVVVNHYLEEFSPLLFGIPTVAVIHDTGQLQQHGRLPRLLMKYILRRTVKRAKRIIVRSSLVKEELLVRFPEKASDVIHVISEGVDMDRFRPGNGEQIRKRLGLDGVSVLLFVGRVDRNKNVHSLIQALPDIKEKFPSTKLLIVGDTKGKWVLGYVRYLMDLAHGLQLTDDVLFMGEVPEDELPQYYACADIFVAPSTCGEGLGLTCLEAEASGKPVVCTELFKRTGVVTEDTAMTTAQGQPVELAEAICKLLGDDKLRRRMGASGREFAENFSWDRMGHKVIEVIREAAV